MLLVVWFEYLGGDAVGFCPLFCQCVYSYGTSRYYGCRSEIMLSEDKSDVCVLYAAAAYDCEFHALNDFKKMKK